MKKSRRRRTVSPKTVSSIDAVDELRERTRNLATLAGLLEAYGTATIAEPPDRQLVFWAGGMMLREVNGVQQVLSALDRSGRRRK